MALELGLSQVRLSHRWGRKLIELRRMALVAFPIGILSGAGVSLLELICNRGLWGHFSELPIPYRLLMPVLGLMLSGWILSRLHATSVAMLNEVVVHYHSPPTEVVLEEDGFKALACVATVGLGASLGLGGPSQWLGARIAFYIRYFFGRKRWLRGISSSHMVLIGAAAGVSAIFRAPLAGTLLALETPYSKDLEGSALLPASIAAFAAHLSHGYLYDNKPLLPFASEVTFAWRSVLGAMLIGLAAGFVSRRFQRALSFVRIRTRDFHWAWRGLIGGVFTSLTAYIAFRLYGDTYTLQGGLPLATRTMTGEFLGTTALVLVLLKLAAVCFTGGTTGVAGLLVVTLTVGSLIGGALQPLMPWLPPNVASSIGVSAYLAANYNAPLTGIALSAEWGGAGLLPLSWLSVIIAAWIGEGLANTPAKIRSRGHRHS